MKQDTAQRKTHVLDDGVLLQWKLEFEKEGFNSSSAMLKEVMDICVPRRSRAVQAACKENSSCQEGVR
eukprot:9900183-Ditylum_brightwellii.AAC.2